MKKGKVHMETNVKSPGTENLGLYRLEFEHDNCGIGAIVNNIKEYELTEPLKMH